MQVVFLYSVLLLVDGAMPHMSTVTTVENGKAFFVSYIHFNKQLYGKGSNPSMLYSKQNKMFGLKLGYYFYTRVVCLQCSIVLCYT